MRYAPLSVFFALGFALAGLAAPISGKSTAFILIYYLHVTGPNF